jgi:hypothetical protein
VDKGHASEDDLADDIFGRPDAAPEPSRVLKCREFSLLRWVGLGLLLGGASFLFSILWWVGLLVGISGLTLVELDNEQRRRQSSGGSGQK